MNYSIKTLIAVLTLAGSHATSYAAHALAPFNPAVTAAQIIAIIQADLDTNENEDNILRSAFWSKAHKKHNDVLGAAEAVHPGGVPAYYELARSYFTTIATAITHWCDGLDAQPWFNALNVEEQANIRLRIEWAFFEFDSAALTVGDIYQDAM